MYQNYSNNKLEQNNKSEQKCTKIKLFIWVLINDQY